MQRTFKKFMVNWKNDASDSFFEEFLVLWVNWQWLVFQAKAYIKIFYKTDSISIVNKIYLFFFWKVSYII